MPLLLCANSETNSAPLCQTVIVLFRPLETHLRIKQVQKQRQQLRKIREQAASVLGPLDPGRFRHERDRRRADKMELEMAVKLQAAAIESATRANAAQARAAKKATKARRSQQRRVIYR